MNELRKIIADNLIDLRKRKKYTQQELGDILGYSDKAISKWEKGDSLPDIEILYKISSLYGVTLDYLTTEGSYEEKKEYILPKYNTRNKIFITLLLSTFIWFIVLVVYVFLTNYSINFWPIFLYGIPANCLILLFCNYKWGYKVFYIPIFSTLCWGTLLAIYLNILYVGRNFWPIFLPGIPFQIAVVLLSQIKRI